MSRLANAEVNRQRREEQPSIVSGSFDFDKDGFSVRLENVDSLIKRLLPSDAELKEMDIPAPDISKVEVFASYDIPTKSLDVRAYGMVMYGTAGERNLGGAEIELADKEKNALINMILEKEFNVVALNTSKDIEKAGLTPEQLTSRAEEAYEYMYNHSDLLDGLGSSYRESLALGEMYLGLMGRNETLNSIIKGMISVRNDAFSSDREVASLGFAIQEGFDKLHELSGALSPEEVHNVVSDNRYDIVNEVSEYISHEDTDDFIWRCITPDIRSESKEDVKELLAIVRDPEGFIPFTYKKDGIEYPMELSVQDGRIEYDGISMSSDYWQIQRIKDTLENLCNDQLSRTESLDKVKEILSYGNPSDWYSELAEIVNNTSSPEVLRTAFEGVAHINGSVLKQDIAENNNTPTDVLSSMVDQAIDGDRDLIAVVIQNPNISPQDVARIIKIDRYENRPFYGDDWIENMGFKNLENRGFSRESIEEMINNQSRSNEKEQPKFNPWDLDMGR